jgi:hypothetical protein
MAISYSEMMEPAPEGFPGAMVQTTKPGTTVFSRPQGVVPQKRRVDLTQELEQLEFLTLHARQVHPRVLAQKTWALRRKLQGSGDWAWANRATPGARYDARSDLLRRLDQVERVLGIGGMSPRMMAATAGGLSGGSWLAEPDPVGKLAGCIRAALCRPRAFCCPGGVEPVRGRGRVGDPGKKFPPPPPPPPLPPRRPPPPPFPPRRHPPGQPPLIGIPGAPFAPAPGLVAMPGFVPTPQLLQVGPLVEAPGAPLPKQQQLVMGNDFNLPGLPPPPVVTAKPAGPVILNLPLSTGTPGMVATVPKGAPDSSIIKGGTLVSSASQMAAALPQAQRVKMPTTAPVGPSTGDGYEGIRQAARARLARMQSGPGGGGGGQLVLAGLAGNTSGLDACLAEVRGAKSALRRRLR